MINIELGGNEQKENAIIALFGSAASNIYMVIQMAASDFSFVSFRALPKAITATFTSVQ